MANDLNYLYQVQDLLKKHYIIEHKNEEIKNRVIRATNPIKRETNEKIAEIENKIKRRGKKLFNKKNVHLKLFCFIIVIAILIIGIFIKLPFCNFNLNDYVIRCQELVDSDRSILLSSWDDFKASYIGALVGNALLSVIIAIFVSFIVTVIIAVFRKVKIDYEGDIDELFFLSIFRLFLFDLILLIIYIIVELKGCKGGGLVAFISVFDTIFGIGLIFKASYPIIIPFFILHLIILFFAYGIIVKKVLFLKNLKNNDDEIIRDLIKQINILIDECEKKVREKENTFKYYDNPYSVKVHNLPRYQQNLTTINSLIWAIENNLAYDIVSARNYFDRKAHEESVNRRLAQIEQQTQQALSAARDAAASADAAYSAARQAKAAAEAPIDIDVEFRWK